MKDAISTVAILCAIVCLGAFLALAFKKIPAATERADQRVAELTQAAKFADVSAKDFAEIVKGLASLAEALVKAGPAFWSLIGSLLLLLIAAAAAGVFA